MNPSEPGTATSTTAEGEAGVSPVGPMPHRPAPVAPIDDESAAVDEVDDATCRAVVSGCTEHLNAPYSARPWLSTRRPRAGRPGTRRPRPRAVRRLGP